MRRALELAERGRGLVSPNPLVGAVVVTDDRVVGEGWHEGPGTPHAEILALREAGPSARGATLYTSLEPCNHFGRTPPCTEAIAEARVARVVSAAGDPNPIVDGRGYERLREAGVDLVPGVLAEAAEHQNRAFRKHVMTGRPFVIWKSASSLDGKVAARDGSSRWITGEAARADVHRLRAWADAIVVGAGTALADDPSLTVREPGYRGRPPLRVLVDARGRVEPDARLFDGRAPTLVATTAVADAERRGAWERRGVDVEVFETTDDGGVPLDALTEHLGKRDVQGLLLEGGPTLAWSALEAGVVDAIVIYLAPKLVGGVDAPSALGGVGLAPIEAALDVRIRSVERIGPDLRVEADVHRDR
jgi:diaminohydroxyphosphoribosylaminopyrimidine deaminase/5-amino-6-(5-phosphoribosylamino)uracil reductase